MAEAFVALGAVAAIFQLVDFGTKVLAKTYEISQSGADALVENVTIELWVTDLEKVANELAIPPTAIHGLRPQDQSELEALITACRPLCKDLLAALKCLKLTPSTTSPKWDALRKGVRSVLGENKLASLQRQLDYIRSQITLRLLSMLRHGDLSESSVLSQSKLSELSATHSLELQQIRDAIKAMQNQHSEIIQDAILQSLLFPQFGDRRKAITEAHAHTFEWIFGEGSTGFKNWLCEEDGIFWISGKAGSGKSTLMKFLARHPMTETLLKQWTGDNRLVMANFYFWSTGHPLEKTKEGLLRSLLFQLLQECHDLIPLVCATHWKQRLIPSGFHRPWEYSELAATINAVLARPDLSVRFCLFIDGMDEYQDDQGKLVQDLIGFSKHSSVKICASSRPKNVFEKSFGTKPSQYLTLEKFTNGDIDRFIKDTLIRDDRFTGLGLSKATADELTNKLRKRANGVFLWVSLVVRSLLRGIDNGDDMVTLHERLNETPSDLNDLFRRMLFGPDNVYKKAAARALQLACHADKPLDPILFCFLQQDLDDPSFALQHHKRELNLWRGRAEGSKHIKNWCHGLLETNMELGQLSREGPHLIYWLDRRLCSVRFFHRTVKDFLTTSDVQSTLSSLAGQDFNPWSTLCRLSLVAAKCIEVVRDAERDLCPSTSTICVEHAYRRGLLYRESVYTVQSLAVLAFYYARKLELTQNRTEYAVLQDFDTVFESLARAMEISNSEATDEPNAMLKYLKYYLRSGDSVPYIDDRHTRGDTLLLSSAALGAQFNLQIFLLYFIRKHGSQNPLRGRRTLIFHALIPFTVAIPMLELDEYPPLESVCFLKEQGCTSGLFHDDAHCWSKYEIQQLLLSAFQHINKIKGMRDTSDQSGRFVGKRDAERKKRMKQIVEILTTSSENRVVSTPTVPSSYSVITEWLSRIIMGLTGNISIGLRSKLNSWLAATEDRPFTILAAFVAFTAVLVVYLLQLTSGGR
ncbi:hypothetical protein KC367_g5763 [Hortaea werneckii]|nr:hypothetical protein KC367_g5763 [Hortaea werneckii]